MENDNEYWSDRLLKEDGSATWKDALKALLTVLAGMLIGWCAGALLCSCGASRRSSSHAEYSSAVSVDKGEIASADWLSGFSAENVELKARIDSVSSEGKTCYGVVLNAQMRNPQKIETAAKYAACSSSAMREASSAQEDTRQAQASPGASWHSWAFAAVCVLICLAMAWARRRLA